MRSRRAHVLCNAMRNLYTGLAVNLDTFDLLVADSRTNAKEAAALYRVRCSNIGTPRRPSRLAIQIFTAWVDALQHLAFVWFRG